MTDPIIGLAVKFIEQGGLYPLLAVYLLHIWLTVWLVKALLKSSEQRIEDLRSLGEKAIQVIEAQRAANEAATRAAEANYRATGEHGALLASIENLVRLTLERRR